MDIIKAPRKRKRAEQLTGMALEDYIYATIPNSSIRRMATACEVHENTMRTWTHQLGLTKRLTVTQRD